MFGVANIVVKSESEKGIIEQEGLIVQLKSGVEIWKVSMQLSNNMHSVVADAKMTIQSTENMWPRVSFLDRRDEIGGTVHQITLNSLDEQIWKLTKERKRLLDKLKVNIKVEKFLRLSNTKHIQEIQLDIRKISQILQKYLLKKREIEKCDIRSSVTTLVIMSITIPPSMEKKTVLPGSIGGNSTFADVSTHTYEENKSAKKEVIINRPKKKKEN
jgi:hypothetical protein